MRCFAVQILVFQMRVDEHSPDGTEHVQQSYLYNGDGTSTVTLYIDPPLRYKNITVSADVMLHISLDAACIMTIRDRAGRDMKKILCGSDYRVIKRVLFRYDAAGRLVEEGEVESGSRLRADMRNLYEYDHQSNSNAAEMHWGDLKEMRIAPLPTEIDLLETRPWSTYYGYEYDAQGNWTYRTEEIRRFDTGVTHTGAMRRTLKYWD
jgi:hypothetical protein